MARLRPVDRRTEAAGRVAVEVAGERRPTLSAGQALGYQNGVDGYVERLIYSH